MNNLSTPPRVVLLLISICLLSSLTSFQTENESVEQVASRFQSAENSDDSTWQLPPIQWVKDLESGYISTAPVVRGELTYVKVGGKSDRPGGPWDEGKGPGIYAFNTYSGDLVWRYEHGQSRSGFEISLPLLTGDGQTLLNGWTSGNITSHDARTGELLWSYETDRQSWGMTGSIIAIKGDSEFSEAIFVSSERGIYSLTWDGELLHQYDFPENATGYRNQVGWGFLDDGQTDPSVEGGGFVFAAGDEQGGLHTWSGDGGNFTTWNLGELLGDGEWKVRTPPFPSFPRFEGDVYGIGVVVQGVDGGEVVTLRLDENASLALSDRIVIGKAPALPLSLPFDMILTGDLDGVYAHCFLQAAMCAEPLSVDVGPVSGELTLVSINDGEIGGGLGAASSGELGIVIPHNTADGFWRGHHLWIDEWGAHSELQWEWHPIKGGWLTAGIGSDGVSFAAGNDASWLEMRYPDHLRPDNFSSSSDLPQESGGVMDDSAQAESGESSSDNNTASSEVERTTATGLPLALELGLIATITLSLVGIVGGSSFGKRFGSLALLSVLLLLLPTLNLAWVTTVDDQITNGESSAVREGFPETWNDTQVVCFEYPEDLWWGGDGQTILISERGEEVGRFSGNDSRLCVGGLTGFTTIHGVSREAAHLANLTYRFESQPLGLFVEDIGPGVGGDGDRWWLYWVDGVHGNLAVDLQPIVADSVIEWRFL